MGHVTRATRSGSGAAPGLVRQQRTRIDLVAIRVGGEARELVGGSQRVEPCRRLRAADDAATRAGGLHRGLTERRRVPRPRPRERADWRCRSGRAHPRRRCARATGSRRARRVATGGRTRSSPAASSEHGQARRELRECPVCGQLLVADAGPRLRRIKRSERIDRDGHLAAVGMEGEDRGPGIGDHRAGTRGSFGFGQRGPSKRTSLITACNPASLRRVTNRGGSAGPG